MTTKLARMAETAAADTNGAPPAKKSRAEVTGDDSKDYDAETQKVRSCLYVLQLAISKTILNFAYYHKICLLILASYLFFSNAKLKQSNLTIFQSHT